MQVIHIDVLVQPQRCFALCEAEFHDPLQLIGQLHVTVLVVGPANKKLEDVTAKASLTWGRCQIELITLI